MEIGEKIKKLRLEKGMTLEELGTKVGVTKSTIKKWENGTIVNIRKDKFPSLANALNVDLKYFEGYDYELQFDKTSIENIIEDTKRQLLNNLNLTIDGKPISSESINSIIIALDMGMEMAKRNNLPTHSLANQNLRIQDAEENYIKSRSMNVQQTDGIASNSIGDTERKVSNQ